MCSTGHGRNRILFIERGLAYCKMVELDFCWTSYGRNGVLLIGRGVAYLKTDEMYLCWSTTVETGVPFIGRGVAYRKTGLHGLLFSSTVDLLQPPRATFHPASTACYSTGYRSTTPLHGLLFIHQSTIYCSSSPPWGRPVHPALHGVLFIQPQPARSIGVMFIQRQHHGVLFIHPTAHCSSKPPQRSLFIQPPPPTTLTVHPEAASIGFS